MSSADQQLMAVIPLNSNQVRQYTLFASRQTGRTFFGMRVSWKYLSPYSGVRATTAFGAVVKSGASDLSAKRRGFSDERSAHGISVQNTPRLSRRLRRVGGAGRGVGVLPAAGSG
jgi:hypothetical protein